MQNQAEKSQNQKIAISKQPKPIHHKKLDKRPTEEYSLTSYTKYSTKYSRKLAVSTPPKNSTSMISGGSKVAKRYAKGFNPVFRIPKNVKRSLQKESEVLKKIEDFEQKKILRKTKHLYHQKLKQRRKLSRIGYQNRLGNGFLDSEGYLLDESNLSKKPTKNDKFESREQDGEQGGPQDSFRNEFGDEFARKKEEKEQSKIGQKLASARDSKAYRHERTISEIMEERKALGLPKKIKKSNFRTHYRAYSQDQKNTYFVNPSFNKSKSGHPGANNGSNARVIYPKKLIKFIEEKQQQMQKLSSHQTFYRNRQSQRALEPPDSGKINVVEIGSKVASFNLRARYKRSRRTLSQNGGALHNSMLSELKNRQKIDPEIKEEKEEKEEFRSMHPKVRKLLSRDRENQKNRKNQTKKNSKKQTKNQKFDHSSGDLAPTRVKFHSNRVSKSSIHPKKYKSLCKENQANRGNRALNEENLEEYSVVHAQPLKPGLRPNYLLEQKPIFVKRRQETGISMTPNIKREQFKRPRLLTNPQNDLKINSFVNLVGAKKLPEKWTYRSNQELLNSSVDLQGPNRHNLRFKEIEGDLLMNYLLSENKTQKRYYLREIRENQRKSCQQGFRNSYSRKFGVGKKSGLGEDSRRNLAVEMDSQAGLGGIGPKGVKNVHAAARNLAGKVNRPNLQISDFLVTQRQKLERKLSKKDKKFREGLKNAQKDTGRVRKDKIDDDQKIEKNEKSCIRPFRIVTKNTETDTLTPLKSLNQIKKIFNTSQINFKNKQKLEKNDKKGQKKPKTGHRRSKSNQESDLNVAYFKNPSKSKSRIAAQLGSNFKSYLSGWGQDDMYNHNLFLSHKGYGSKLLKGSFKG